MLINENGKNPNSTRQRKGRGGMKPSKWIRERAKKIYKEHDESTIGGIAGAFDMAIMEYLDKLDEQHSKDGVK